MKKLQFSSAEINQNLCKELLKISAVKRFAQRRVDCFSIKKAIFNYFLIVAAPDLSTT